MRSGIRDRGPGIRAEHRRRLTLAAALLVVVSLVSGCTTTQQTLIPLEHPPLGGDRCRLHYVSVARVFPVLSGSGSYAWVGPEGVCAWQKEIFAAIDRYASTHQFERASVSVDGRSVPESGLLYTRKPPLQYFPERYYESTLCLASLDPLLVIEIDRPIEGAVFGSGARNRVRDVGFDSLALLGDGVYASRVLPSGGIVRWWFPKEIDEPPRTPNGDRPSELGHGLALRELPDGRREVWRPSQ